MTTTHTCPHCGGVFEDAKAHKRSTPQHRRFMAICNAAFHNWPDAHEFRPRNVDHLRYWLEMRAGHFTVTTTARISSSDPDKVYGLVRAFLKHSEDVRLFIELDGNLLVEKRTKSIDYASLGSSEFSRLKDEVCLLIEEEIGIAAEKLLRETEKAA